MYLSEIRPSQINALLEKVATKNYGKYLYKINMANVRGFKDQSITFDFPVTALIGPNGGGKTTILGAAACPYKEIKPRLFFAKNGKFDQSMREWKMEYEMIDRTIRPNDLIRRTASFLNAKWSRDATLRQVAVFGVSRTVPPTEKIEFQKFASRSFDVDDEFVETLTTEVASAVAKILGKDVSQYSHVKIGSKGNITLLTGVTPRGLTYSEFHFGAGESSVIRMLMKMETLEENSLVLIEEIENGLHPLATVRMVEHLIDLAERKKIQAIFTTHSNDALAPLPSPAIWASINQTVLQGKLDVHSLRAITGQVEAKLAIFTEDEFSKNWVVGMLREVDGVALDAIEVHGVQGDGTAVRVNKNHNSDPTSKFVSICLLDGDSQQTVSDSDRLFKLPGASPERTVFDDVVAKLDTELLGTLTVKLLRPYEEQHKIRKIIHDVNQTNRDPHVIFSQIGRAIGFIPEDTVKGAFISQWCQAYPEKVRETMQQLRNLIPMERDDVPLAKAGE